MNEDIINDMLDRVEICAVNGQPIMAQKALNEVISRVRQQGMVISIALGQRIDAAAELVHKAPSVRPAEAKRIITPDNPNPKALHRGKKVLPEGESECPTCEGTGKFLAGFDRVMTDNVCVHCAGKGWQSPSDIVRNKNYAAARERLAKTQKAGLGDKYKLY